MGDVSGEAGTVEHVDFGDAWHVGRDEAIVDEDSRSALSEPLAIDVAAAATELSDEDDDEEFLGDDLLAAASSGSVPESSRRCSILISSRVCSMFYCIVTGATLCLCVSFLSRVDSLLLMKEFVSTKPHKSA